jgi:hypothetical protein
LLRLLRPLSYAVVGAAAAVLLGRALQLVTGLACTCFLGDPLVAVRYGALGGAFFAFIYRPDLFARRDDEPAVTAAANRGSRSPPSARR